MRMRSTDDCFRALNISIFMQLHKIHRNGKQLLEYWNTSVNIVLYFIKHCPIPKSFSANSSAKTYGSNNFLMFYDIKGLA